MPATSSVDTARGRMSPTARLSGGEQRRSPASSRRCSGERRRPASPPTRWRPLRLPRRPSGSARARGSRSCSPSARTPTPATTPRGSVDAFPGQIDAEGTLLDELPDRLDRFHYDLVATTTFHADEAQALVHGRVPVVAMLVGPGYVELVHEIAATEGGLPGRAGLRVGARRGQHGRDPRAVGYDRRRGAQRPDGRRSRHRARSIGPPTSSCSRARRSRRASTTRFERPERIRQWSYEFDPSGPRAPAAGGGACRRRPANRGGRRRSVTSCPNAGIARRTNVS